MLSCISVDTHARTHTYAITITGIRTCGDAFPVTGAGMNRAIVWIGRNATGTLLVAGEGTASSGASLTRQGINAVEVKPPSRRTRAGVSGTDKIEATAAARGILGKDLERLAATPLRRHARRAQHTVGQPTQNRPAADSQPQCPPRTGAANRPGA